MRYRGAACAEKQKSQAIFVGLGHFAAKNFSGSQTTTPAGGIIMFSTNDLI